MEFVSNPRSQSRGWTSGLILCTECSQRREHHRRTAFEDAQWPVWLHGRSRTRCRHGCWPGTRACRWCPADSTTTG